MLERALFFLSGYLPIRFIAREGERYLERYHLCKLGSVKLILHRFVSGDQDEEMHNHPWRWAVAIVLSGHYLEARPGQPDRRLSRFQLNLLKADTFHRIVRCQPDTWTLFIHGRRVQEWGFSDATQPETPASIQPRYTNWYKTAPRGKDTDRYPLGQ
jgi:hypothetical protein